MSFIVEEEASQETKEYLLSLHIKLLHEKNLNCENLGMVVIEKETKNMLFEFSLHSNYPISLLWEYIIIYKKVRAIILLESFDPYKHRVISIEMPETIWEEKQEVLNLGIEMIYILNKSSGPKKSPIKLNMTRDKFIVNTDKVIFYKEKLK